MIDNIGAENTLHLITMREERIRAELADPCRYGNELETWKDADAVLNRYDELLILGGNRSSKSEYAARRMAQAFLGGDVSGTMPDWLKERAETRGIRIWCFHTNHMTSVSSQQNVVYKYLPQELKMAKKTKITQVAWSQKNGFSDNTAVYNKNQIWFLNYAQDIKVIEGAEVDFVWCDELVPQDWLETLRYRLVTRNGKLLVTFTPLEGYSQVVKEFVSTSRITGWRPSELLPNVNVTNVPAGNMPVKAEGVTGKHGIVWFHSQYNPYNNWERMKQTIKGRSSNDIKIRAYGWAEQLVGTQFPMFGDHNIWGGNIEDVVPEGTNYMVSDPAGARNWFMLWARVDGDGVIWVYREWPDQSYGEWALPSEKMDGKAGPAQKYMAGRGIDEYCEMIKEIEGKEVIGERYIDPRSAGSDTITRDGGTTLLDLLGNSTNPIYFTPAASINVDERVLLINDLLSYSRDFPLMRGKNHPKIMVHESCQNLIYSLREWTGVDGQKGACKDPIDALGYMVVMSPQHFCAKLNGNWTKLNKAGSY